MLTKRLLFLRAVLFPIDFIVCKYTEGWNGYIPYKDAWMIEGREVTRSEIMNIVNCVKLNDELLSALNPRLWDKEYNDAWHSNIPDTEKAFDTITSIALKRITKQ